MLTTEASPDTRAVAELLATVPVGEIVSFAALSAAIGRDITRCRHVLYAGKRAAERDAGAVFATVRGQGMRRLSAERAAETVGTAARSHIRKTARKATRTLIAATSRANDLPPAVQRSVSAEVSAFALIEHLSRDAAVKAADDAPLKPTPVAITARAMMAALHVRED